LAFGAPLDISVSEKFGVQTGINFVQKGYGLTIINQGTGSLVTSWLEVPFLAKLKFGTLEGLNGGIFLGPSIGFAISGQISATSGGTTIKQDFEFKTNKHSQIDFGLQLGGEFAYKNVFLDARYLFGLSNMNTTDNSSTSSVNTRGIAITAGYRFALGANDSSAKRSKK
jgi:hypothetical protein